MIDDGLVHFTEHAKKQMIKRHIGKEKVFITLNYPDHIKRGSHSNETIAIKHFDDQRIRVIYVSEPYEIRIITVTH